MPRRSKYGNVPPAPNDKGSKFFNRLLQSVQQMDAIVRGESQPSRMFVVEPNGSIGSDFDDFLAEHGLTEEVTTAAIAKLKEYGAGNAIIRKLVTTSEMNKRGVRFLPEQVVQRAIRRELRRAGVGPVGSNSVPGIN